MKKYLLTAGLAAALLLSLPSCGSYQKLYSWHTYENASYVYYKTHSQESEEALLKSYCQLIEKQYGQRKAVPPGIYAEYGYLLIKKGEVDEGLEALEEEKKLYPESTPFVNRIIEQLKK